jgi:hypothetical protein
LEVLITLIDSVELLSRSYIYVYIMVWPIGLGLEPVIGDSAGLLCSCISLLNFGGCEGEKQVAFVWPG